jgi:hypothetical protein
MCFGCARKTQPEANLEPHMLIGPPSTQAAKGNASCITARRSIRSHSQHVPSIEHSLKTDLFSLPAELRNEIYLFATQYNGPKSNVRLSAQQPPLTRVNRQLRNEVLPIYYEHNLFKLPPADILRPYLERYSNLGTQCPFRYVHRIETSLMVAKPLAKASLSFWSNFCILYIRLTITTDCGRVEAAFGHRAPVAEEKDMWKLLLREHMRPDKDEEYSGLSLLRFAVDASDA